MESEYRRVNSVAKEVGLCVHTLLRLVNDGKIPHLRLSSKTVLVRLEDVSTFISNHSHAGVMPALQSALTNQCTTQTSRVDEQ